MGKTVLEVNVTGVEKRRHPNKHYVGVVYRGVVNFDIRIYLL